MDRRIDIEDMEVSRVMDLDNYITTYKSIFHAMTASAESKSVVFDRHIYVEIDDLCELYDRITEKLDIHYKNAGSKVKINVSFDGKRNYLFDNWSDFSNKTWHEVQPITSIIIKWEYHIIMPDYPVPQPHVLVVKISDGLKFEQMINLMFTGKIENIELIEEEVYPVVARVDYINHNLGDELLNIVSEWNQGLKQSIFPETNKWKKGLLKHKGKWAWFLNGLMKALALCLAMLCLDWYLFSLPNERVWEMSSKQASTLLFILFTAFISYLFVDQMARFCSNTFLHYIGSTNGYHVFGIDKGDRLLQNKSLNEANKNIRKAVISFTISVVFNVVCGIISSIIATKLFL